MFSFLLSVILIVTISSILKVTAQIPDDLMEPVSCVEVPEVVTGSINIDGQREGTYSSLYYLNYPSAGELNEPDLSAFFQMAYDSENLYLYVNVTDDIAHVITDEYRNFPTTFDHIAFYSNVLKSDSDSGSYDEDAIHIVWCRGSDSAFFPNDNWYAKAEALNAETFKMEYIFVEDTVDLAGYCFEAAIPFSALFEIGQDHAYIWNSNEHYVFGLEISVGDSDGTQGTPGSISQQLFWDDDEEGLENAWFDTRTFGVMGLVGTWVESIKPQSIVENKEFFVEGNEITFNDKTSVYDLQGTFIGEGKSFYLEKGIYIARGETSVSKFMIP